jgi:RNA-directed DNA polymerase
MGHGVAKEERDGRHACVRKRIIPERAATGIVRYADDFVLGFQYQKEAERFLEQLQERMREYGLELHSEKTRLIEFGRFAASNRKRNGEGKPETFNFLGFTHTARTQAYLRHGTQDGPVHRKAKDYRQTNALSHASVAAKLRSIKVELRRRMHQPIAMVGQWLRAVVQGYFNYFAVPGNFPRLNSFVREVTRLWWHVVRRRSQHGLKPAVFYRIAAQYLPRPAILHPYPTERFYAKHPKAPR